VAGNQAEYAVLRAPGRGDRQAPGRSRPGGGRRANRLHPGRRRRA
jgi:hypothetical protein